MNNFCRLSSIFIVFSPNWRTHAKHTHNSATNRHTRVQTNAAPIFGDRIFPRKKKCLLLLLQQCQMGHAGWSKRYSVAALGTSMNDFPLFCLLECLKLILFGMQNAEMMQCLHFWLESEWIRVVALHALIDNCCGCDLLDVRPAINWTEQRRSAGVYSQQYIFNQRFGVVQLTVYSWFRCMRECRTSHMTLIMAVWR